LPFNASESKSVKKTSVENNLNWKTKITPKSLTKHQFFDALLTAVKTLQESRQRVAMGQEIKAQAL